MRYNSQKETNVIPSGIVRVNGLSIHVAFGNVDRFVHTAKGKNILPDTVGIIYHLSSIPNSCSVCS